MIFQSYKLPRLFLVLMVILVGSVLGSCGTTGPTGTPTPTDPTRAAITDTPEPPTPTAEPTTEEVVAGFLLPSATPAPTQTPGAVTELISEFTQAQGLEDVTVFWISVEDWLNLGYSILLTFIIGFLFSRLLFFVLTRIAARTESKYDDIFIKQIRWQIYAIIITFGFQVGTVRLDILEVVTKLKISRVYNVIYVVAGTIILWRLLDLLVQWFRSEVEPQRSDRHQADALLLLLHRFGRVLLISISGIMLLSLYNINVTALIAALGVGGLAISLAAQDTLSNVISGVMIMIDQPFRVGDRIEIQKLGTWGDVVDIGLRSTRIRTRDNRLVIVPNNTISTDQVVNYTYPDPRYRIQIEIGIAYGQEIEKVRQIIIDSVSQVEGVLADKPVDALVVSMDENTVKFRARWWIESYRDTRYMNDRVYTDLLNSLEKAGIAMPSDTCNINILKIPGEMKGDIQDD